MNSIIIGNSSAIQQQRDEEEEASNKNTFISGLFNSLHFISTEPPAVDTIQPLIVRSHLIERITAHQLAHAILVYTRSLKMVSDHSVSPEIGILGGGLVAQRALNTLLVRMQWDPKRIHLATRQPERIPSYYISKGVNITKNNLKVVKAVQVLIIAVNTAQFQPTLVPQLRGNIPATTLVYSLVNGVSAQKLNVMLNHGCSMRTEELTTGELRSNIGNFVLWQPLLQDHHDEPTNDDEHATDLTSPINRESGKSWVINLLACVTWMCYKSNVRSGNAADIVSYNVFNTKIPATVIEQFFPRFLNPVLTLDDLTRYRVGLREVFDADSTYYDAIHELFIKLHRQSPTPCTQQIIYDDNQVLTLSTNKLKSNT